MSFLLPYPPDVALYPVKGLETYLESLKVMGQQHPCPGDNTIWGGVHELPTYAVNGATTPVDTPETTSASKAGEELAIVRRRNIIRVADFLFGTMLEGAMTTLDMRNTTEIVSVQSRRRMFILTSIAKGRRSGLTKLRDAPHHYFCFLPCGNWSEDVGNEDIQRSSHNELDFYFCSCRSYFERSTSVAMDTPCTMNQFVETHADSSSKNSCPQFSTLCKHLLALKLGPFLVKPCKKVETVTEAQFSQVVLKSLFGGRNCARW